MDDLIKRQDAIDAMMRLQREDEECYGASIPECFDGDRAVEEINALPSAHPEIIRCKDCKWWDKSENSLFGYCMAIKHGYMSANWEIGIYRRYKGDFYCADAERRSDETDS